MSKEGPGPRPSDTYPAGILYLGLAFRQPADCRLQSATMSAKFPLDTEAQYLSQAMDKANMHSIPMVIPEPQPATFYPSAMHSEAATDTRRTSVRPDNVMLPTVRDNTAEARIPRLQTDVPPTLLRLTDALPNLMPSTHDNMARAAGLDSVGRSGSTDLESLDLTTTPMTVWGGTTLVDDDQDTESPWESNSTPRRTVERQGKTSDESGAEKTMKGENHPFNEPPMEVGLMLKLLHWLQCVTIWELISAMLGVAALTGEGNKSVMSSCRQIACGSLAGKARC